MINKESLLMSGIPSLSEFYFVHSYYFKPHQAADILNETEYEERFVSSIQRENIFGVQYHPEKSHDVGEVLLKNFINL
jgi:glutamine amidotransferase